MLRSHNFTPKVPDSTYKNKASNEEIEKWQKALKRWLSCVKRDGFKMYVMSETILLHGYVPKRGPWSPRDQKDQKVLQTYFASVFFTGKKIRRLDVSQICQKTVGTKRQGGPYNGCRIPT